MNLSNKLIKEFAKQHTEVPKNTDAEIIVNGEIRVLDGKKYVKIDGGSADILTPVSEAVDSFYDSDLEEGDRVRVSIRNHEAVVVGNYINPPTNHPEAENIIGYLIADQIDVNTFERIGPIEGKHIILLPTGIQILDAETLLASFEDDRLVLGCDSVDSIIEFAGGDGSIRFEPHDRPGRPGVRYFSIGIDINAITSGYTRGITSIGNPYDPVNPDDYGVGASVSVSDNSNTNTSRAGLYSGVVVGTTTQPTQKIAKIEAIEERDGPTGITRLAASGDSFTFNNGNVITDEVTNYTLTTSGYAGTTSAIQLFKIGPFVYFRVTWSSSALNSNAIAYLGRVPDAIVPSYSIPFRVYCAGQRTLNAYMPAAGSENEGKIAIHNVGNNNLAAGTTVYISGIWYKVDSQSIISNG